MDFIDLDQPSENDSPGADSANGGSGGGSGGMPSPYNQGATGGSGSSGGSGNARMCSPDFSIRPQFTGSLKSPDASFSKTLNHLLNRVLDTTSNVAGRQQELFAKIQSEFAGLPKQPASYASPSKAKQTPSARAEGQARANYRPWGETIKQPENNTSAHGQRPAREAGNGSEGLPGSGPGGRLKTATASSAMNSPLNLPTGPTKLKSPENADIGNRSAREVRIQAMQHISQKIVNHENKHAAILNDSRATASAAAPQFTQSQGPDGRKYAMSGEVNADLTPIPGKPHATEKKAESIYRSALHDSDRSSEDDEAGRKAMFAAQSARYEGLRKRAAKAWAGKMESPENAENAKISESLVKMHSPQNSSPYAVKMKIPPLIAAAGRAIATGARAAASYVARGAAATGRAVSSGAHGARNFLGSVPSTRFGKFFSRKNSSGNAVETRAEMLARAFRNLENTSDKLESSFFNLSDRLKNHSPDLAIQQAFNNLNRVNQNMRQAQQIGKPLAEFERQKGRAEIAARDIQGNIAEALLPIMNRMAESTADIMEFLAGFSQALIDPIKGITGLLGDIMGVLVGLVPGGKTALAALEEMRRLARVKADKDQKAGSANNLNAFFNMKIPIKDTPNLQKNPFFNMPIFMPNP